MIKPFDMVNKGKLHTFKQNKAINDTLTPEYQPYNIFHIWDMGYKAEKHYKIKL